MNSNEKTVETKDKAEKPRAVAIKLSDVAMKNVRGGTIVKPPLPVL